MTDGDSIAVKTTWRSHVQTTNAPRLTPHDIWTLEIQLHSDAPLRIASVVHSDAMFSWALVESGPKLNNEPVEEHIAIGPWSGWAADEDRVQIRVGLLRANFADRAMLDDPRSQVELISPDTVSSGSFIPILLVPAHDATFGLIAIDTDDTEVRRGRRWRLRPDRVGVIDPRFEALASGRQSGSFPE